MANGRYRDGSWVCRSKRAGSISQGKRLPAVHSNMSWYQAEQLDVWHSISVLDYILINFDQAF